MILTVPFNVTLRKARSSAFNNGKPVGNWLVDIQEFRIGETCASLTYNAGNHREAQAVIRLLKEAKSYAAISLHPIKLDFEHPWWNNLKGKSEHYLTIQAKER
jgi:hypothetical protein